MSSSHQSVFEPLLKASLQCHGKQAQQLLLFDERRSEPVAQCEAQCEAQQCQAQCQAE